MDCELISAGFFDDVPEEDELPLDFEIPGPIPDLIGLYSFEPHTQAGHHNNININNQSPSSCVDADDDDDDGELPVDFTIQEPFPDLVDLYVQKPANCYRRPRVQNLKTCDNNPTLTRTLHKLDKPRVRATARVRVSKTNTKTLKELESYKTKPRVCKRHTKTGAKITKNGKPINEVCEDMPKFFPKQRRSKIAMNGGKVSGMKKPCGNAVSMLLR